MLFFKFLQLFLKASDNRGLSFLVGLVECLISHGNVRRNALEELPGNL